MRCGFAWLGANVRLVAVHSLCFGWCSLFLLNGLVVAVASWEIWRVGRRERRGRAWPGHVIVRSHALQALLLTLSLPVVGVCALVAAEYGTPPRVSTGPVVSELDDIESVLRSGDPGAAVVAMDQLDEIRFIGTQRARVRGWITSPPPGAPPELPLAAMRSLFAFPNVSDVEPLVEMAPDMTPDLRLLAARTIATLGGGGQALPIKRRAEAAWDRLFRGLPREERRRVLREILPNDLVGQQRVDEVGFVLDACNRHPGRYPAFLPEAEEAGAPTERSTMDRRHERAALVMLYGELGMRLVECATAPPAEPGAVDPEEPAVPNEEGAP